MNDDAFRVEIKLFPDGERKLGRGDESYSCLLRNLFKDERPLLFIPRLNKVTLFLDDWNCPIARSASSEKWCRSAQLVEKVDDTIKSCIDKSLKDEHCRIPRKYKHMTETAVSFACRREGRKLIPEDSACLYCYLPARDADWGFKFLLNSDMIPNGKRTDIEYSISENRYFAKVAGKKFFEWISSLITSREYDCESIFEIIPDFEECKRGRSKQVQEFIDEFRAGFETEVGNLPIPSDDDTFFAFREIIIDDVGVSAKFPTELLEMLGEKFSHLECVGLRQSFAFQKFRNRYCQKLSLPVLTCNELNNRAKTEDFKSWYRTGDNGKRLLCVLFENSDSINAFGDDGLKVLLKESMLKYGSDLGVYEFANKCMLANKCMPLPNCFGDMPVENSEGHIQERVCRQTAVFYYDEKLIDLLKQPWANASHIIVLSSKYNSYQTLFGRFGTRKFELYEFVVEGLRSSSFDMNSSERVDDFHLYLKQHMNEYERKNLLQTAYKYLFVSVIRGGVKCVEPWSPSLFVRDSKESSIAKICGEIANTCGFICCAPEMEPYWLSFGNKRFDTKEMLNKYVDVFLSEGDNASIDESVSFIRKLSRIPLVDWDGTYEDIKKKLSNRLCLFTKDDAVEKVGKLRFGSAYRPSCEYEKYGLNRVYLSEAYIANAAIEDVKGLLKKLGVTETFFFDDLTLCENNPEFCKYLWREFFPSLDNPFMEEWIQYFNKYPCIINSCGKVCRPRELYSIPLIARIGELPSWQARIPDLSLLCDKAKDFIKKLESCDTLIFEDAVDYLKKIKTNEEKIDALRSIAKPSALTVYQKQKVVEYRACDNALWLDGSGELKKISELIAISSSNSDNARSFSGLPGVMRTRKILGDSKIWEPALKNLGVTLISDNDLEKGFQRSVQLSDIPDCVKPGLLVYAACRENDDWQEYFSQLMDRLSRCEFIRCDSITLSYKDMVLSDRRVVRENESKRLYFVGDMQGKRVFESIARAIRDWLDIKGEIEELKDFLDADVDLASIIFKKCRGVLKDKWFVKELMNVDAGLYEEVTRRVAEETPEILPITKFLPLSPTPKPLTSEPSILELPTPEPQKKRVGDYEVGDDEYEQLTQLFGGGLADEDDEQKKKWQDESKLACLRLFNYLEECGFEPSMDGRRDADYVIQTLYADIEEGARPAAHRGPNIDVNTRKRIHVISAKGGVAYVPPVWWKRLMRADNNKYEICAITGAKVDELVFITCRDDLLSKISDNALPVKVRGVDSAERAELVSAWFSQVDAKQTAAKLYALLKVKANSNMNKAFEKGFCNDEMSAREAEDNSDL